MQQVRKPKRRDPEARGAAPKSNAYQISVDLLKVSAMRIPLTVMIAAIAMFASPLAYGQASGKGQTGTHGTSGKPSGPAVAQERLFGLGGTQQRATRKMHQRA